MIWHKTKMSLSGILILAMAAIYSGCDSGDESGEGLIKVKSAQELAEMDQQKIKTGGKKIETAQPAQKQAESASGHAAAAPPPPSAPGEAFAGALIDLMNEQLRDWRPNDIVVGQVMDNKRMFQIGVLDIVRESVRTLKDYIARIAGSDTYDPHTEPAEAFFWNDPMTFWFPSAEGVYKNGVNELVLYKEGLPGLHSKFVPRSDNLYVLLSNYIGILGDSHKQLVDEHVKFFKVDNVYYQIRGRAVGFLKMYEAINIDYRDVIEKRGLKSQLNVCLEALESAEAMHPWIILNGEADDFRANHRMNLAAYLSEVHHNTQTMVDILQK